MNELADECPHGLGMPSACVLCNGRQQREDTAAKVVVRRFPTMYDGPLSCGHLVEQGDTIAQRADGRYICENCT